MIKGDTYASWNLKFSLVFQFFRSKEVKEQNIHMIAAHVERPYLLG